jgi:hypothetical protein
MNAKKVFLKAWLWLDLIITIFTVAVLITISYYSGYWFLLLGIFLPSLIIFILRLRTRVIVPAEWEYVYTWCGKILEPFTPGVYYIFPYFNLLSDVNKVLMTKQVLHILSGTSDGLPEEVIKLYRYGSRNNIHSKSGSSLRLMYDVVAECVDSKKLVFGIRNVFDYVAQEIERKVNIYVRSRNSKDIINRFAVEDWHAAVLSEIRNNIRKTTGINLISFTPIAIINDPVISKAMLAVEEEVRRGDLLRAKLKNMSSEVSISSKNDEIRSNEIKSLKETLNIDGYAALNFLSEQAKWKAFIEISKSGKVVYMDDLMGRNFNQRPIIVNVVK